MRLSQLYLELQLRAGEHPSIRVSEYPSICICGVSVSARKAIPVDERCASLLMKIRVEAADTVNKIRIRDGVEWSGYRVISITEKGWIAQRQDQSVGSPTKP